MASHERWTLRLNNGSMPWWILNRSQRVPGTRMRDYWQLRSLMELFRSHFRFMPRA